MVDEYPVVFVGFKATAVERAVQHLAEPVPPANYTKQETLDAWRQDKYPQLLAQMYETAAYSGITGQIDDIYAVDPMGKRLATKSPDLMRPATAFLRWLAQDAEGLDGIEDVRLIGFGISDFSRICGLEAQMSGIRVPPAFWATSSYSYDTARSLRIDPYRLLVSSDQRANLSVQGLLDIAGIPYPQDWQPHVDPYVDCELAIKLALKFNLTDYLQPSCSSFRCNSQIGVTLSDSESCGHTGPCQHAMATA